MNDPAERSGRGRPPMPMSHILDESFEILVEDGVENLGMRSLARRLGCSTSTLYRQLPGGKSELHLRLAERVMKAMTSDILIALSDQNEDASWTDILERAALAGFDYLRANPYIAALFGTPPVRFGVGTRYSHSIPLMVNAGLSAEDAASADHAIARLVVGYALRDLENLDQWVTEFRDAEPDGPPAVLKA